MIAAQHTHAHNYCLATMQVEEEEKQKKKKAKNGAKAKTQRHAISHTQKPVTECKMRLNVKATMCMHSTHSYP